MYISDYMQCPAIDCLQGPLIGTALHLLGIRWLMKFGLFTLSNDRIVQLAYVHEQLCTHVELHDLERMLAEVIYKSNIPVHGANHQSNK